MLDSERRYQSRLTFRKQLSGKVWQVTVLRAGLTSNGEIFAPEVLEASAPKFEGLPVHAYGFGDTFSHTPDEVHESHPGGLFLNGIGVLKNVSMGTDVDGLPALLGEIHIDEDEHANRLKSRSEEGHMPQLSVDIKSRIEPTEHGLRVLDILEAHSLDVVTSAAAGGRFDRMVAGTRPEDTVMSDTKNTTEIRSVDGLRAAYPELCAQLTRGLEQDAERLTQSYNDVDAQHKDAVATVAAVTAERDSLKSELETVTAERDTLRLAESKREKEATVAEAITEVRLKESIGTDKLPESIRGQLMACDDKAAMVAILKDIIELGGKRTTESLGHDKPSRMERTTEGKKDIGEAFEGSSFWSPRAKRTQQSADGDTVVKILREALRGN